MSPYPHIWAGFQKQVAYNIVLIAYIVLDSETNHDN